MFDKFVSESQLNMKPWMDLVQLNMNTVEKAMKQNTGYVVESINAQVSHSKAMAEMKDMNAAWEAQQSFAKQMSEQMASAAKANFDLMNTVQGDYTKLFQDSFSAMSPAAVSKPAAKK